MFRRYLLSQYRRRYHVFAAAETWCPGPEKEKEWAKDWKGSGGVVWASAPPEAADNLYGYKGRGIGIFFANCLGEVVEKSEQIVRDPQGRFLAISKLGRTEKHPPSMPDPGHASLGVSWVGHLRGSLQLARWVRFRASIRGLRLSLRWARPPWRSAAHRSVFLATIARSLCNRNARGRAWRMGRDAAAPVD